MNQGDGLMVSDEREAEQTLTILVVGEASGFGDIPAFEYARNLAATRPRGA